MSKCKCQFPDGVTIKPDGVNELDPCVYVDIEMFTNVTVIISKCKKCGHIDIGWQATDDTEHVYLGDAKDE